MLKSSYPRACRLRRAFSGHAPGAFIRPTAGNTHAPPPSNPAALNPPPPPTHPGHPLPFTSLTHESPLHEIKAQLFKALGHPARVRLLELLAPGERPVSDLLAETGLEASLASQHLAVLRRAGVVVARREGNAVHYRLADASVVDLLTTARTFLATSLAGSRAALDDLEQVMEADGTR